MKPQQVERPNPWLYEQQEEETVVFSHMRKIVIHVFPIPWKGDAPINSSECKEHDTINLIFGA